MESIDNRLFDLLESFTFDALNEDDKLFVLTHMTEQEFRNQQKIIAATDELEYPAVVPLPLAIPNKKGGFWMAPVPLYQLLAGVAAAIIAVVLLWPKNQEGIQSMYTLNSNIADTVYHTKLVHDTVYKTEIEKIYISKNVEPKTVYVDCDLSNSKGPKRMLEVNTNGNSPSINPNDLTSKTNSMKNDETLKLLPEARGFGL